ncbi:cAMP-dependent protein kinase inhibitor beta-like isoform X2 [Cylas formicarius]|nr:cAMP-dependent protein kinase inhibitor beta-like isoform X2 [Cylas formicarius]XP_060516975.1 cAMP-dependent protein kinase inhibitor beta-like isoform X2 [Cylas formicarius]
MLAVMEATQNSGPSGTGGPSSGGSAPPTTPENGGNVQEFLSSGRTGRRNALPDILGQHAIVTSSDLPSRLQALTTSDSGVSSTTEDPQPGPSSGKS